MEWMDLRYYLICYGLPISEVGVLVLMVFVL